MSSTQTVSATTRRGPGTLTLHIATTIAEVEQLRQIWEPWQEHPNSVMDHYLSRFAGHDPDSQPYVMVVYRDGQPDCLLLGKQLPRGVTSAVCKPLQPAGRVLYFLEGGLLGSPSFENCRFLVREIVAMLRRGEADAAEFCGLRVNSSLYRASCRVPNFFSRDHFPLRSIHRYALLPDTLHEFRSSLPPRERQNFSYRERRLLKAFPGKVRVRCFHREEDGLDCLIAAAEEIAASAYQRALGRGFTLADAAALHVEACNGSLRGYVLYIDEKPCAYLIASWQKGVLYGTFVGHDPAYAQYAPGRFLLMRCIEDCFNHRERTVLLDPGAGDQPYKRIFTNIEREEAHVTVHPPTFRGFLCNLARTARYFGAHCAKVSLASARLLPFAQKVRRRRAVIRWRSRQPACPSL